MTTQYDLLVDPNILHTWSIIPGLVWGGEYPNSKDGDLKKIQALQDAGIQVIMDLTHPNDNLTQYDIPEGMQYICYPIEDNGVPTFDEYIIIMALLTILVQKGINTYIHCWGGIGRTALIAGGLMVIEHETTSVEDVFKMIDKARKNTSKGHLDAPATQAQRDMIKSYRDMIYNL